VRANAYRYCLLLNICPRRRSLEVRVRTLVFPDPPRLLSTRRRHSFALLVSSLSVVRSRLSFNAMPVMFKGYRLSVTHIIFYISASIIGLQLWSVWKQSSHSDLYARRASAFNADLQSNVHTFSNEQCDAAFPQLYHSLDKALERRGARKVHVEDIGINQGRCMLRVMIYDGEVCTILTCAILGMTSQTTPTSANKLEALCRKLGPARSLLRHQRQRTRTHPRHSRPDRPRPHHLAQLRPRHPKHRVLTLSGRSSTPLKGKGSLPGVHAAGYSRV
jgi:hypothetical protein